MDGDELTAMQVDNPIVWNLLKPVLRLATIILHHECQYAWYDLDRNILIPRSNIYFQARYSL